MILPPLCRMVSQDNISLVTHLTQTGHNDLGILSLVVSDAAGLYVLDKSDGLWYNAEIITASDHGFSDSYLPGVMLSGREMQHFTNGKYSPGPHAVVSPGKNAPEMIGREQPQYRYSLVFILRGDESKAIDYEALASDVTGVYAHESRCDDVKELFKKIRVGHWNVNMTQKEREEQKRKIAANKPTAKQEPGHG